MKTKTVKIGSKVIGGGNPILIQSMTNTKTEDIAATVAQITKLAAAGFDTSAVIWRMERDAGGFAEDSPGHRTWRNRLTFTLAEKPSSYPEGSTQVTTKVYEFDIWYKEGVKGSPVSRYGDIESGNGKAALEKSSNGQFYVLRPTA